MIFTETPLSGAYLIDLEPHRDERGFFARTFCRREYEARGLNPNVMQCNTSWNRQAGTLRGLHYRKAPSGEAKLVRCIRGAIHDVIVDCRSGQSFAAELTAENRRALFVPEGFAHGFQTLMDDSEVEYQMSEFYDPHVGAGYRYDDPAFAILWPRPVTVISSQDLGWPAFCR